MATATPIILFGEVLLDHFPDGKTVLGGAPFNVAWHLQAFGAQPLLISRIGEDEAGRYLRTAMQEWGLCCDGLQNDPDHPTGRVTVQLDAAGEPSYFITPDVAFDHIAPPSSATTGLLYHGSLVLRSPVSAASLQHMLQHHRGRVFFDVNLRAPWWQREQIDSALQHTDWLKLNDTELAALTTPPSDLAAIKLAVLALQRRYQLDTVVVTRGAQGALAIDADGECCEPPPPSLPPRIVDTVGAGDAFSAVLLLGMCHAWPLQLTLDRAQEFALAILGQQGAIPTQRGFYQPFIRQWRL